LGMYVRQVAVHELPLLQLRGISCHNDNLAPLFS
jgi:hypothetical protein